MPTYTVTRVKHAGQKPNPHGGQLEKFYVGLKNETEEHPDVYWQRKEGSTVEIGDEVYGSVTKGEFGWRFKSEQRPDGRQNGSGGSYGGGYDDETVRRITRSHSQEMALRWAAIQTAAGNPPQGGPESLKSIIDWFDSDVGPGVGNPPAAVTPAAAASPPAGPGPSADRQLISEKQHEFLGRLLSDVGMDVQDRLDVLAWAEGVLTGGREGSASKAIGGLTNTETRNDTAQRLLTAAKEWVRKQSDVPADERDLPELNATNLDPMAEVGMADDSVPF